MCRDEVKALERLENWGGTLFLGAIALIAKQIIDWSAVPAETCSSSAVTLHWPIYLLPALVGWSHCFPAHSELPDSRCARQTSN
jgi:hypothetical protein